MKKIKEKSAVRRGSASIAGLVLTSMSLFVLRGAEAANVQTVFTYPSSVTLQSGNGISLKAELNYNNSVTNAPVAVVMHGYSTGSDFANVRANAQLRESGYSFAWLCFLLLVCHR